jgi:hypothetical protein
MAAFEQKVKTVANNDTDINTEIALQNADNWIVGLIVISGTDVIILFSRTVEAAP